jgi:RNA polymerase primary sigma factor
MRQLKISKQITNRETESLDKYLNEVAKISLITAEEEVQLTKRIREGDEVALHKLVSANLRFVVSVAKQYQNNGMTLSDLINEGNLGLIKAAQRFDETRGFKFISYAVWWIRQTILQALSEQSRIVRLPLNRVGSLNKINKTFSELEQKYQREPSVEELAQELDTTSNDISETIKHNSRKVSLDAPLSADSDSGSLLEVMESDDFNEPDHSLLKDSLKTEVQRALERLTLREAQVISMYFGISNGRPTTLDEIGHQFNLTRERVRQIKEKATRKLKHGSCSRNLKQYLN